MLGSDVYHNSYYTNPLGNVVSPEQFLNSTSSHIPQLFQINPYAFAAMVSCGFLRTRLGLYSTAAALCLPHCLALNILQIDTTVGRVFGLVNGTFPRVAQFLGIPYAEPPVGDLRWERSVAKSPVAEIDATRFSPSCPQYDTSIPSVYEIDAREFLVSGPTSENCLTVSVWAPFNSENCTEQLPVVVWYYGGGQLTGGAQIEYQIPTPWVERTSSHIVVQVK